MRAELGRLAAALTAATDDGTAPTPVELAEVLWLAAQLAGPGPDAEEPGPPPAPEEPPVPEEPPAPTHEDPPAPAPPTTDAPRPAPRPTPAPRPEPARVHLYVDPSPAPDPASSLLTPAPPMLRHPLALQRALRPLRRHVPSAAGRPVLDEAATADRIARLGAGPDAWLPVLRPAPERWLRLALVHDTGPTMPIWRPLLRELHTALTQSGIFRTVTVHPAGPDGRIPRLTLPRDGRTAVLLLSDCTGPQWHPGEAAGRWYRTLWDLASRAPLAILQPLPEHLWRTTAAPAVPGRFASPHAAAPLPALRFTPYAAEDADARPVRSLPLPVLEAAPRWLANWSRVVGAPAGAHVTGAAAWLTPDPPAAHTAAPADRTPEDLVRAFRATASPEAFRLAGHLAVGVPHLPVMRLVHAALERDPRPQHLAEVVLSGLLTTAPGPPGSYAFRDGVRDLLLRSLPRSSRGRTTAFLARVGGLIDERAGVGAGEFRATTRGPEGEAFAAVSEESVRRLSGGQRTLDDRYRLVRALRASGSVWEARDLDTRTTVAVKLHGPLGATEQAAFHRTLTRLARLDHPNVVTVHDFGVQDGTTYVVMEHLDGIPLNALAAPSGYRLPGLVLSRLAQDVAAALLAVHGIGAVHGGVGMTRIVLLRHGTAKLTLFAAGRRADDEGRRRDIVDLGTMLSRLNAPERVTADLLSTDADRRQAALRRLADQGFTTYDRERHAYRLLGRPEFVLTDLTQETYVSLEFAEEQAMLCMLLLRSGRAVTHAELTEGIWGGRPPKGVLGLLGSYATRLRHAGAGTIATLPEGYAIHTGTDTFDVDSCQNLVGAAEAKRADGDLAAARDHITDALVLFRGTPLDGVPGPAARTARTRLTQLRLTLHRTAAELDLDLGEFGRAAADLAGLTRAHPSREDFRRLQMIALHRLGRIDEALEAYEDYEAVGGRVGPGLEELHRDLLAARDTATPPSRTSVTFDLADDAGIDLLPVVVGLIEAAGLTAREHALQPVPAGGYEVVVKTDRAAERLLETTVTRLPATLSELPAGVRVGGLPAGVHVTVTFWPAGPAHRAARDALRADLATHAAASCVAVAPGLVDPYTVSALGLRAMGGDPPTYWYRMVTAQSLDRLHRLTSALRHLSVTADPSHRIALTSLLAERLGQPVDLRHIGDLAATALNSPTGESTILDAVRETQLPQVVAEFTQTLTSTDTTPDTGTDTGTDIGTGTGTEDRAEGAAAPTDPPVRGPLPMPPDGSPPVPTTEHTALVHARPDGSLTLTAPDETDLSWEYYEVDLAERTLRLDGPPAAHASVRVDDPLEAAQTPALNLTAALTERLETEAARLPAPVDTEKLHRRLDRWPLPGYTVRWHFPEADTDTGMDTGVGTGTALAAPAPARPTRPARLGGPDSITPDPTGPPTQTLATAEAFLLAFEGPLVRLYPGHDAARDAARELTALAAEVRDPADALSGRPLARRLELDVHPLDVLRAFAADRRLSAALRERLEEIELRALSSARPTVGADQLVRTLNSTGRPVAVVSDVSPHAISAYLQGRSLAVRAGVHGRTDDPARLMPHPDALHRALHQPGSPTPHGVLIGSSPAELLAARAIDLPFVGYAPTDHAAARLTELGARHVVRHLSALIDAVRTIS